MSTEIIPQVQATKVLTSDISEAMSDKTVATASGEQKAKDIVTSLINGKPVPLSSESALAVISEAYAGLKTKANETKKQAVNNPGARANFAQVFRLRKEIAAIQTGISNSLSSH